MPAERAEAVLTELVKLAPRGFEQVDGDGFVEFALYGAPGELPDFPEGPADVAGARVQVSSAEVDDGWAERWKEFHRPVLVGDRIQVRPPWVMDLVVDPGQAFGTGAHPTTQLCLELLLELDPGRPLADLGCGSGVLAIAAAKLGFAPIYAFDNEREAVEATLANAERNGVKLARVERHDLRTEPPPVAAVTVANLVRPLLLRMAQLMPPEPPDSLIVSGLLEGEEDEVAAAFAPLRERRRVRMREWSALLLARP